MSTLPQNRFGDPLAVLLKAEAETCKGCRYRVVGPNLRLYDYTPEIGCSNPRTRGTLRVSDKRCDEYEEATK